MKKLEKRIIQNIYLLETKQTLIQLVLRISAIVGLAMGGTILALLVVNQLFEQQSLDIFEILFEDIDIIRNYFIEAMLTFMEELPKTQLFLSLLAFILSFLAFFTLLKNFSKFRNKVQSLIKYWFIH